MEEKRSGSSVYPPVRKFRREFLKPMGIAYDTFLPDGSDLELRISSQTRLVWAESPGSTTMEVADLERIAAIAHRHGVLAGCDNTWATPLNMKPLELGVDFSMQALTKYAGGHSDVLMGAVAVRLEALHARLQATRGVLGIGVSPDDCALVLRGLESMGVRLRHAASVSLRLAEWLAGQPSVVRVLHPALPDCTGHEIWRRQFAGASGTFSVELDARVASAVDDALAKVSVFRIGASWGGTRSLIVPMQVDADRERPTVELGRTYLRLSVGVEDPDDLVHDLEAVFARLNTALPG